MIKIESTLENGNPQHGIWMAAVAILGMAMAVGMLIFAIANGGL